MGATLKCAKCGDEITSSHVHDFRHCKCRAIFVDGGDEYLRVGGNFEDILIKDENQEHWVPVLEAKKGNK